MKSYVLLTFGLMGWVYYEMSGGSDFTPVETEIAALDVEDAQSPEIVTRASSPALLAVSAPNMTTPAAVNTATTVAATPDLTETVTPVVDVAAPQIVEAALDIREVTGTRVNMRMGPGTGFDVITTLDGGTQLEVLEVNADGWANVSTVELGVEGWMAARLLTAPET